MKTSRTDIIQQNSVFLLLAIATGLVLLVPLIAMQFSEDVVWSLGDFIVMGVLLFATGSIFIWAARRAPRHRLIIAVVVAAALLWVWVELAVGLFTGIGS
jgi:hypothetical protein